MKRVTASTQKEDMMAPEKWKTRSSKEVYKNQWIRVREDMAELPNGRTTIYGVVEMANEAVGVLPFVDDDHVMLVQQYRYVFDEADRWEIPTGGLKPHEEPEAGAQRELQEEIGHTAERLEWVSTLYTSKSVCHEIAHLYIGYGLSPAELPSDETEEFEHAVFPFDRVLEMVNRSEIRDAMTVIAVLHAARLRTQQRIQ
jgi:ADP-ribose pyrophosphatase